LNQPFSCYREFNDGIHEFKQSNRRLPVIPFIHLSRMDKLIPGNTHRIKRLLYPLVNATLFYEVANQVMQGLAVIPSKFSRQFLHSEPQKSCRRPWRFIYDFSSFIEVLGNFVRQIFRWEWGRASIRIDHLLTYPQGILITVVAFTNLCVKYLRTAPPGGKCHIVP